MLAGSPVENLPKEVDLVTGCGGVCRIRAGKVGHDAFKMDLGVARERREYRREIAFSNAKPGHAGVDFEMNTDPPLCFESGKRCEALDLGDVVNDGHEVVRKNLVEPVASRAIKAPHHQNGQPNAGCPKFDGLFQERYADARDPRSLQGSRYCRSSMTVRIGLEDAPDCWRKTWCAARGDDSLDGVQVMTKIREVDFGTGRTKRVRGCCAPLVQHTNFSRISIW